MGVSHNLCKKRKVHLKLKPKDNDIVAEPMKLIAKFPARGIFSASGILDNKSLLKRNDVFNFRATLK